MTFGITFIHIWIIHSFNKLILTNLQQIKHETQSWVFALFFRQLTTYDISRPHRNYNSERLFFYDTYDLMKPYNIFRIPTPIHGYFTTIMTSWHFSLVLPELQILNPNLRQTFDNLETPTLLQSLNQN